MLTGMELDKRPELSSGFVPFLGLSGVKLGLLGSTASPTIPMGTLEAAYNNNAIGAKPIQPEWTPLREKMPILQDYYNGGMGGGAVYDEAAYQRAVTKYYQIVETNKANKTIYESNLAKYNNALDEWNKAIKGVFGVPKVNKPSSPIQQTGLSGSYSGLSGMNF
jgi:hypothetical protein